jgi:hypothetical protein
LNKTIKQNNKLLIELARPCRSIAFVGICKNAGKTTVLNFLTNAFRNDFRLGISSVGVDGETRDVVTKTEKPRIFIDENMLVATSRRLLSACTCSREVLFSGGYATPLGEVVIFRAKSGGFAEIGGPSVISEAIKIKDKLISLGCEKVFFDGAFDRRSLSVATLADGIIFSTAAGNFKDIDQVAKETAAATQLLTLKKSEIAEKITDFGVSAAFDNSQNLIDEKDIGSLLCDSEAKHLYFSGAVSENLFKSFLHSGRKSEKEIIVFDGSRIFLKADMLQKLQNRGLSFSVVCPLNLLAITVNPFSAYGHSFDKNEFFDVVSACTALPVFDVMS